MPNFIHTPILMAHLTIMTCKYYFITKIYIYVMTSGKPRVSSLQRQTGDHKPDEGK